jgi:hypothetical protein
VVGKLQPFLASVSQGSEGAGPHRRHAREHLHRAHVVFAAGFPVDAARAAYEALAHAITGR